MTLPYGVEIRRALRRPHSLFSRILPWVRIVEGKGLTDSILMLRESEIANVIIITNRNIEVQRPGGSTVPINIHDDEAKREIRAEIRRGWPADQA